MCFHIFASLFNVCLNRKQSESHSCCFFRPVVHYCGEVCEENPESYRYAGRKGKSVLIGLPDDYGYLSLILHQNSTSGSFLKVKSNV